MTKVLFLDIDGVLLPGRAYTLPNQTNNPYVTIFDPCAVAMLNKALETSGRKIVLHSSWIKHNEADWLFDHIVGQGVSPDFFHEDWTTNRDLHWRYDRVRDWLSRHKEVTDFVIVDDEPALHDDAHLQPHLVLTNFDEGITVEIFKRLRDEEFVKKELDNRFDVV